MKAKPEASDDEIRSYMDFDRLMDQYKAKPSHASPWRNLWFGAMAVSVIAIGVRYFAGTNTMSPQTNARKVESSQPRTAPADSLNSASDAEKSEKPPQTSTSKPKRNPSRISLNKTSDIENSSKADTASDDHGLQSVFAQAEPVAGYEDLYAYFRRELKYPEAGKKDSIQGEVSVIFTIDVEGKPRNISVENSLGAAFDLEAVRLIANMPAWKPATYNHKPVASRLSIPLTFQLKRIEK